MKGIGVPSIKKGTNQIKSAGIGAVGGGLYALSQRYLGTGLWGALGGIFVSGMLLDEAEAKIISTQLGFQTGHDLVAGWLSGNLTASTQTTQQGI